MNMKKIITFLTSSLLILTLITGCSSDTNSTTNTGEDSVSIVTTSTMITDLAKVLTTGNDKMKVTGIMGAGIDPHLYKPTAGDAELMQNADLIVYNGLHFEGQMGELFKQMKDQGIPTVSLADKMENFPGVTFIETTEFGGNYDPHMWFDINIWKSATIVMKDALVELDPDNKSLYEDNTEKYLQELDDLASYVNKKINELPLESRVLITAHDAFNYFGRMYDFDVRGVQGISTESEAGTKDIKELASFIVERKIGAIFVENSVPKKNIEALQAAVKAQGFNVNIGGELLSDSLSEPNSEADTYITMVRYNVDTIVKAIQSN
jgi:manganese/zinc/iron transport system substrate-binding protein